MIGPLPDGIERVLVRGLSRFMKATPRPELPPRLAPLRDWHDKRLMSRKAILLDELEDAGLRARIVQWLDDGRVPLRRDEAEILRIACERADGWTDELAERAPEPDGPGGGDGRDARLEAALAAAERARAQLRRAREEARAARERADGEARAERTRAEELEQEVAQLRAELEDTRGAAERERARAESEAKRAAQAERRARVRAQRDRDRVAAAVAARKDAERKLARLEQDVQTVPAAAPAAPAAAAAPEPAPPNRRSVLRPPRGLLADDAATLDHWLDAPNVHLVVDGYNVTRAEGGFGDLPLEAQRDLLADKVEALVRRKDIEATIVFDGSDVPAAGRRRRGRVRVEYSAPARDEAHKDRADDHIVELIDRMPKYPVVLVTNDGDLRARAAALAATVAASGQLLALLR